MTGDSLRKMLSAVCRPPPYADPVTKQLVRACASHDVARENGEACLRSTHRTPHHI